MPSATSWLSGLAWFGVVMGGYWIVGNQYGSLLPGWVFWVVLVVGWAGAGILIKGLEVWRWRRMSDTLGLDRLGNSAVDEPYDVLEAHRGEYNGRTVTVDYREPPAESDGQISKSIFVANHAGNSAATITVRNNDKSPGGDDDLPAETSVPGEAFGEQFTVHSDAPSIARQVIDDGVRESLLDLKDDIVELRVEDNRVVATRWERLHDTRMGERYLTTVCRAADQIESGT